MTREEHRQQAMYYADRAAQALKVMGWESGKVLAQLSTTHAILALSASDPEPTL